MFLCIMVVSAPAQVKTTQSKAVKPAVTNQVDGKGVRTGFWWITNNERMGEGAYTEFGHYDHGNKTGRWYKMDGENNLISIESYKDDVLNGEVRYFEKGKLTSIGHYRGINHRSLYDTIVVVDPGTGSERQRALLAEKGSLRHGTWRYYDSQTGKLLREEEYQVDNLIYKKEYVTAVSDSVAYLRQLKKMQQAKHIKTRAPKDHSYISY